MSVTPRLVCTYAYYAAFIALGLVVASLGPTLPGLAEQVGVPLSQISFLFATRSSGYLIGTLIFGRVYDHLPGHPILSGVMVLMAAAMAMVPFSDQLMVLALVLFCIGVGEGTLDVGGNILLVWNHPENLGPYMNGLHFCFGVGAFLSPIVVAQMMQITGTMTWAYGALALLITPAALTFLLIRSPAIQKENKQAKKQDGYTLYICLVAACFFAFVGAEVGIGGWIYTYAVRQGLADETVSAYLTSGFWGALTLGRLIGIPIAAKVRPNVILMADIAGAMGSVLLILIFPQSVTILWLGTIGAGLFIASMFATLLAFTERHIVITARVTGWFFAGSSLGAMSVPYLIGQFFERVGPHVTLYVVLIDLMIAWVVFLILLFYARRVAPHEGIAQTMPVPEPVP
jgi:FHS family Na+ dependent glucose MFS transporter 1